MDYENGDDVDHLDHRVDGRSAGVFVGITHGVAGDGCGVCGGMFSAVVTFFDELLGVIPCAAGGGHCDADEEAGNDGADEHAAENGGAECGCGCDSDNERDGEEGGENHFAEGGLGDDVDATTVLGSVFTFEDAGAFGELATDFCDDGACGFAHGVHAEGGEQEGEETSDEKADEHFWIVEGELDCGFGEFADVLQVGFEFFDVGAEEYECGESCGGDGVAFGDGFHGVTDGVKFIGDCAHFFGQAAHDGDAAGVVGDGAECVEGDDDAGHGEHGHDRDGDAVQVAEVVGGEDGSTDEKDRQRGGVLSDGEAGDDVGGVAGFGGFGDFANWAVLGGGVVVRDGDDDAGHEDADESASVDFGGGVFDAVDLESGSEQAVGERVKDTGGNEAADGYGGEECVGGFTTGDVDVEDSEHGTEDGDAAEDERIDESGVVSFDGEGGDENRADE